jgi:hypothetical protein
MRTCIGLDIHREFAEVGVWEGGTVRSAPRCPAADLFGHKGRAWLQEQELPADERQAVAALLRKLDFAGEELRLVDAELGRVALEREEVKRLTTIPGVAATVALSIVAAVGDFHRFSSPQRLVATSPQPARAPVGRPARPARTYHQAGPGARAWDARRGGLPDQAVSSGLTGADSDLPLPYRVWLRSC